MRENLQLINGALDKNEIKAAFDAADQWASDNAASFNSALPQPARDVLNASQKALLLNIVIAKRHRAGA